MTTTQKKTHDFKRWIIFNSSLENYKNLYDFYNAVKDVKKVNESSCVSVQIDGISKYAIENPSAGEILEVTDEERHKVLAYLRQHYFHTDDIHSWFRERERKDDRVTNHQYVSSKEPGFKNADHLVDIEPHSKEVQYFNLRVVIAVFGYLAILTFLVSSFLANAIQGAMYGITIAVVLGFLSLVTWIVKGMMIGFIKGNAVRITDKQYPEVFQIVSEQARQLQLETIPEIYLAHGFFNAFVMRFARTKVLMLYSEVLETSLNGDDNILRFVIGHELGHIKREHLTKEKWLMISNIIPFLSKAYSRGCEYTCDRIGYEFSRQGAVEGILILATGKAIYTKINVDHFVNESVNSGSFWMWLSEKFSTHPHTAKRLNAIREYAQNQSSRLPD